VSKDGKSLYVEVYRPIGEKQDGNRKLPVFYDSAKNYKDSKVAKLSLEEVEIINRALKIFIEQGLDGFEKFASRINDNDKFKGLLFPHRDKDDNVRLVGLKAYKGKDNKEYVSFVIQEGQDNSYASVTSDIKSIIALQRRLDAIVDYMIKKTLDFQPPALGKSVKAEENTVANNDDDIDVFIDDDDSVDLPVSNGIKP
jgi:hypothetical protein